MAEVKPIPDGYPRVSPYLYVAGASAAIDFYCDVLGFTERMRMDAPNGKIGHAEVELGDAVIMLCDEMPEMGALGPKAVGGSPISMTMYVEDVDTVFDRAIAAGSRALQPVEDQFYGDRSGTFQDPFGHTWTVMTHVEDVSATEMAARSAAAMEER